MMKVLTRFLVLSLCFTLILLGCTACKAEEKVQVVHLSEVTHSVFYAPLYVAINEGYFAEKGIEIELSTGEGADKVMTAVLSGSADVGFAGPEAAIYVYNEGRENYAQVFGQVTKRDGSFLVAREPSDDFQWSDLKGSHILPGRKGGVPYMTFEYVLRQNGVIPGQDVLLDDSIKFDLMAGAFTGGTGDYFTCFEPVASTLEQEGRGYIVASVGEAGGEIPYTAFFAAKDYLEENKELVQNFVDALYKGQQYVMNNSAETVAESVQKSFPDTDMDILVRVVQNYMDIDAWNDTPVMTEEVFERLQDIIEDAGELDKRASFEDIVNNSFAEKAAG